MRAGQKENTNYNSDGLSDSVAETIANFGFLTPEKKRSRSATSPAKKTPSSPQLKRAPLTDLFSSSERPIYLPNQDEHNQLGEMLSQFEHNFVYPRRVYRFEFDGLEASLWQPMKAEFYQCINALVLGNNLPTLPDFIKIHEIKAEIKALFEGDPQHPRKKRSLKSHVNYFKDAVLALHSGLTPALFHFNYALTDESDITIAKAYLTKLGDIPTLEGQYIFLQVKSNLEHLLIAANRQDLLLDFCLEDYIKPFWDSLVAEVHPEIINFLMNNYLTTEEKIEDIHPFHFIHALYDLHRDLLVMSVQLDKILTSKLGDYLPENSLEALKVLRTPFSLYSNKKSEELNSIRLLTILSDNAEFNAIPELDFNPTTTDLSYLECIRQKTFSQHMRTLFRNYVRLINDYYDFATQHAFAGAQQTVFDKVERLPGIDDSAARSDYKQALATLNDASQILNTHIVNFTDKLNNLKAFILHFINNKIYNIVLANELRYQQKDQCYLLWISRVLDYLAENDTYNVLDITEQQSFADTLHQHNIAIFQVYELTEAFRNELNLKIAEYNQIKCDNKFVPQLIKTGFQLLNTHLSKHEQKALQISQDAVAICNSINAVGMSLTNNIANQSPKLF